MWRGRINKCKLVNSLLINTNSLPLRMRAILNLYNGRQYNGGVNQSTCTHEYHYSTIIPWICILHVLGTVSCVRMSVNYWMVYEHSILWPLWVCRGGALLSGLHLEWYSTCEQWPALCDLGRGRWGWDDAHRECTSLPPTLTGSVQGLLHQSLWLCIEGTCGLV